MRWAFFLSFSVRMVPFRYCFYFFLNVFCVFFRLLWYHTQDDIYMKKEYSLFLHMHLRLHDAYFADTSSNSVALMSFLVFTVKVCSS